MAVSSGKHNRMQQLIMMLKSNPNGLRKAEIARRLGVHRSTVGRYIDQLSLSEQIWERDSYIGLLPTAAEESDPHFNIYEGAFLYTLVRLYQQELNVKNPYASSVMRKLAESFTRSSPVLSENLLNSAELLDCTKDFYSSAYVNSFEKISEAWTMHKAAKISYNHKITGESCSTIFEPEIFFTSKNIEGKSDLAIAGVCRRTGELCRLKVADFTEIQYPVIDVDIEAGYQNMFCPVSEFALKQRPYRRIEDRQELNIKEANHRIKNSLFMTSSLVSLAFADIDDPEILLRTKKLQSRIDTIAGIHEQLSLHKGADRIPLDAYLGNIISRTLKLMPEQNGGIRKRIKIDHVSIFSGRAVPLGMIVSELITNSFKHANSSEDFHISFSLKLNGSKIKIRYSDGGPGFQLKEDSENCGSEIIKNFCRQLDCTVSYKKNIFILEFRL